MRVYRIYTIYNIKKEEIQKQAYYVCVSIIAPGGCSIGTSM